MYQLFEFTGEYLKETISVPGGLSDYFGRFLTQFYLFPAAGAAINAILVCATYICFTLPQEKVSPVPASLGLIPAFCIWVFLLSENALIGGVIALLLAVLAGEAVHRISHSGLRALCIPVLLPLMYMACGPLAVLYALIALRGEKMWIWVVTAALAAMLPFAARYLFECPAANLWAGVHFCRYRNILPEWLWYASAAMAIAPLAGKVQLRFGWISSLAITGCFVFPVIRHTDTGREETMKYAYLTLQNDWRSIISSADETVPKSLTAIKCLNLAFGMCGELGDKMFHFPQEGPDCLIPDVSTDFIAQITTAEVFRQLGLINTAKHFVFEAQEGIPDFQKSGFCYIRLAEANMLSGNTEVAYKYFGALKNTLFYRKWSEDSGHSLQIPTFTLPADQFFNHSMIKSILGLAYASGEGHNKLALDYLLSYSLLEKNLDFFGQYLPLAGDIDMPESWNEALLLRRSLSGENVPELEEFRRGPASEFSKTYWSYYFFRYNGEN